MEMTVALPQHLHIHIQQIRQYHRGTGKIPV